MDKFILLNKMLIMVIILSSLILGVLVGSIQYDYEVDMCNNLDVNSFNYDLNLELSGQTAKECYGINNHPLAQTGMILMVTALFFVISLLLCIPSALYIENNKWN